MSNIDHLKFFDPSDMNAAYKVARSSLYLLQALCEAIDRDELRMPKDGTRVSLEREIARCAMALRLDCHSDDLLSVDDRMSDPTLSKLLGKLFCRDGRELPAIKHWDGSIHR